MKTKLYIILCIFGYCFLSASIYAQDNDRLVRFKAVFVYNFIDFIQWPETDAKSPFKIGIIGQSPLEVPLQEIARKTDIAGRNIQVKTYDIDGNFGENHLIFITASQIANLDTISAQTKNKHILTIADTPGLAKQGIAINFVLINDKLRFEINQQALQKAQLKASAQLLKLAILVDENQ